LTNTITIKQQFASDVARCFADEGQLENALLNLVLNARDAMQGRGEMTISARNVDVPANDDSLGIVPGQYVAISVQDNGVGIDSDQLSRIMEPFYTTKPVGEGTGLGLSMVYGFAKQSGGQLAVTSSPGEGSTFTLYLPTTKTLAQTQPLEKLTATNAPVTRQIVLIEDEPEVQQILILSLERCGFEVKAFSAAVPALDYLADHTPDLVVSDLVLGSSMNGLELAEQARSLNPELPFLLISGNADHVLSKRQIDQYANALLRKPFTSAQLRTAVEKLLT
jgi:CheY-like chemotaxis protein/anti-sigma regulatory factor (Ser/Thr protein kinase)